MIPVIECFSFEKKRKEKKKDEVLATERFRYLFPAKIPRDTVIKCHFLYRLGADGRNE